MRDFKVYMVWGPDPQWGNGAGVKGYFASASEARSHIAYEKRDLRDKFGPRSEWPWPYDVVDYAIDVVRASSLNVNLSEYNSKDEVLEYLNEGLY